MQDFRPYGKETRDESPSSNLGRGMQGDAIPAAGIDFRDARLRCESEVTLELMTVSSISDCKSGCTIEHARDWGTVCVQKRGEWYQEESRDPNEQRACCLCVEQSSLASRSEGKHPREYAEALMNQHPCNRVCESFSDRTTRSIRLLVAELVQRHARRLHDIQCQQRKVLGRTQRKLKKRKRSKFARRRDRTKTSSRMLTEFTLTYPSRKDFCSTGGTSRRSRTWRFCRMRAERGSNAFGRTTSGKGGEKVRGSQSRATTVNRRKLIQ